MTDEQQPLSPPAVIKSPVVSMQEIWKRVWEKVWPDLDFNSPSGVSSDFVNTNCPFHGDAKASSGVNINTGYFNCFSDTCVAHSGFNFKMFIKNYYKLENDRVVDKMLSNLSSLELAGNTLDKVDTYHNMLLSDQSAYYDVIALGITPEVISELQLGFGSQGETFSVPILIDDTLLGFKYYNKNPQEGRAKAWASKGLFNGLMTPINQCKKSRDDIIVICAGEKDMLVARSNGLNAVTIIGGEGQLPTVGVDFFKEKNKEIWIAYDNDVAGKTAGKKLANYLFNKKKISKIKNLTSFHRGMKEKEDVTDFFMTHYKTEEEFRKLGHDAPYWTTKDSSNYILQDQSMVSLTQAANPDKYGKTLNSFVQVKATVYEPKSVPAYFNFIGIAKDSDGENFDYHFDIEITTDNMHHILGLTQPNTQTNMYIKNVLFNAALRSNKEISPDIKRKIKYGGYSLDYTKNLTIFSSYVGVYKETEIILTKADVDDGLGDDIATFTVYTLNKPLQTSQIYRIEYRPTRNEFDNNTIVLMCSDFEDSENSIHSFEIGEKTTTLLKNFVTVTTVSDKISELFNIMKNKRIKHLNFDLWFTNELTFHTPLNFVYRGRNTRGVIYANIIGDTRVGKSELSQELVALYHQGKFINAKLTTPDAIIGGSVTRGKESMIQAGILPKANKSLVVLEEIHGLGDTYFKKITEVKSSGKVIINRVSGELKLDCAVRLIEIANPKTKDGESKTIAEFSNGVEIIKNLISAPEDIARNDLYLIVPRAPLISSIAEEFTIEEKEAYRERIKWVWSRDNTDIVFEDEAYIWDEATKLNEKFDCPGLALLGAEAHIKLARLSVALAGMLASTNKLDYTSIYVKNEHVAYCRNWLDRLYSNEIMRVDEYVIESRQYDIVEEKDIRELRRLLMRFEPQIKILESGTEIHSDQISQSIIGDNSSKTEFFNAIQTFKFVRMGSGMKAKSVSPSVKFRTAMRIIRAEKQEENTNGMGRSF